MAIVSTFAVTWYESKVLLKKALLLKEDLKDLNTSKHGKYSSMITCKSRCKRKFQNDAMTGENCGIILTKIFVHNP